MPSPFPGMDPYLEYPGLWPDVHHNLISECQGLLASQLRPKYLVRVAERSYITDESDPTLPLQLRVPIADPTIAASRFQEEVHEAFLKISDCESRQVVTVIEILSPPNKLPMSPGGKNFEENRREVMQSASHWVEIDLLRGTRLVPVPRNVGP